MEIIDLEKVDPTFSEDDFLSTANQRVKKILNSISMNEMDKVKHFMNWEVYDSFNDTMQSFEDDNMYLVYREVNVDCQITTVQETDDSYVVGVDANCQYIKYYADENGNPVSGDPNSRVSRIIKITFQKNKDARPLGEVARCLGCGCTMDIDESGICPNCGRTFDLDQFDYIITKWG